MMRIGEIFSNAGARFGLRTERRTFCLLCRAAVELVSLAEAASFVRAPADEISQLIRRTAVHCLHNSRGEVLICAGSLQNALFYVRETGRLGFETLRDIHATRG